MKCPSKCGKIGQGVVSCQVRGFVRLIQRPFGVLEPPTCDQCSCEIPQSAGRSGSASCSIAAARSRQIRRGGHVVAEQRDRRPAADSHRPARVPSTHVTPVQPAQLAEVPDRLLQVITDDLLYSVDRAPAPASSQEAKPLVQI